ncbi:MAG: hypothetical protein R3C45_16420 [Phycisphaerales bacterium]
MPWTPGVVIRGDNIVRDVAASAAGDEYLRADLFRAIYNGHAAAFRGGASGEDRRHQARRARADGEDVVGGAVSH